MAKIPRISVNTSARSSGVVGGRAAAAIDYSTGGSARTGVGSAIRELARATQVSGNTPGIAAGVASSVEYLQEREEKSAAAWARKASIDFELGQQEAFEEHKQYANEDGSGFVDGFRAQYKTRSEELLKQAPTMASRERLEASLLQTEGRFVQHGRQYESKTRAINTRRNVEGALDSHVKNVMTDPTAMEASLVAVDDIIESSELTAVQKAGLRDEQEQKMLGAWMQGQVDRANSIDTAEALTEEFEKGENAYVKAMDARTFAAAKKVLAVNQTKREREFVKAEAAKDKAHIETQSIVYSELLVRQARGEDVDSEIAEFRKTAANEPSLMVKWASLVTHGIADEKANRRAALKEAKLIGEQQAVATAYVNPNVRLNTHDKKTLKAVDAHYLGMMQNVPADEQVEFSFQYSQNTGVVPTAVRSLILNVNTSTGSAASIAMAAETIAMFDLMDPTLLAENKISGPTVDYLKHVQSYRDQGMDDDEAVAQVRELRTVPVDIRNSRRAQFKTAAADIDFADELNQAFEVSGVFNDDEATASVEVVNAYERLFKDQFALGGDKVVAREAALGIMKRTYGRSEFAPSGDVMKWSPEKMHGDPNLSTEQNAAWIRKQVQSSLSASTATYDDRKPEDLKVWLTPANQVDPDTGRPLYLRGYLDRTGTIRVDPKPWAPDYSQSEQFISAALEEERETEIKVNNFLRQRNDPVPERKFNIFGHKAAQPNVFAEGE